MPDNPRNDSKLAALRELSFLTVRPANLPPETVESNLGEIVESQLAPLIILSMFNVRYPPTDHP